MNLNNTSSNRVLIISQRFLLLEYIEENIDRNKDINLLIEIILVISAFQGPLSFQLC